MRTPIISSPRAGKIGEPSRTWIIIPAVSPVPPPLRREEAPKPQPDPRKVPATPEPVPA